MILIFIEKFIPDMSVKDIHSIDLDTLKKRSINGIILDIDNTLESHRVPTPTKKTIEFLKRLHDAGFHVCLISNGKHERVEKFNESLGYLAIARAGKPLVSSFKKALSLMRLKSNETAMIGDQIFTDVYGGNKCGIFTVLVEPIESYENGFFYIKRFFEKRILRKIKK